MCLEYAFEPAFTEILISEQCGVVDELYYTIVLTNPRGQRHELGKFVGSEHRRFDELNRLVGETVVKKLSRRDRKKLNL